MNERQQRFVQEYLLDLNATQAAIRAGYSEKTSYSQGQRLLKDVEVADAVETALAKRSERVEVTQDWVVDRLVENVERAMQAQAVYDREGNETGEYTYQGSVANRALELLGKHVGMFSEKSTVAIDVNARVEVEDRSAPIDALYRVLQAVGALDGSGTPHRALPAATDVLAEPPEG